MLFDLTGGIALAALHAFTAEFACCIHLPLVLLAVRMHGCVDNDAQMLI